jgi:phosphatidylinositol glycan class B
MKTLSPLFAFTVRVVLGLYIQSYFHADEYWQYQEIPYEAVFGKGFLTYEWRESSKYAPMRSPLYHYPTQILYYLLKYTGFDYGLFIAYAPRLLSGLHAGLFDIYLVKNVHLLIPSLK